MREPPFPDELLPTTMLIPPPVPPVACPVRITTPPLFPDVLAPVPRTITPELPADNASAVVNRIDPEPALVLDPDEIAAEPPTPVVALPLDRKISAPKPPIELEEPATILTGPAEPCDAEPLLTTT